MEFPFSKQAPTMQAGGSSVSKNVSPIPNSNPKSFEIFERRGGVEASSQGLRHFNAIDLGGSGDIKRDLRSSAMNFGQGIPAGDNAPLNGVESEIMLSLDEILDDLHKKVVSVDVNEFGVRGNSANPLGFGSGNPIAEPGVASLPRRNEQQKGTHAGIPNQHKGEVAGSLPGIPATGNQIRCTVPDPSVTGGKSKDVIRSEVESGHLTEDAAGPQGNQQNDEVANFRGTSEQRQAEDEAVQGTVESYKGEASGSLETNDQSKGEVTGSVGINDQSTGQTSGSVGISNPSMSQVTGSDAIHDQNKGKMLAESDKALGPVVGGALEPFLSTPRRGRQISRKITEIIQSPDWLPEGWFTELKTRETGSSAGTKDKYFYDPVSQRRFRSKAEVFSFLETGKIGRYKPKAKSEGEVGRKRKVSSGLFQNAASFDHNIRPTKVRWVLNDSEGSWIPFINEDDLNGFNSKEGECTFDLNRNSADAYDHVQGGTTTLKDTSWSSSLKSNIIKSGTRPSTRKKVRKRDLPLSNPCFEYAVQTLTGPIPNLEENLALSHALQNYFVTEATPLQILGVDSGKSIEIVSDKHPIYQLTNNFTKNPICASGSLPGKELNGCTHSCREKQLTRHDTKKLLEPLGRKLCNQAINVLKGHKFSSLFLEKRPNDILNSALASD